MENENQELAVVEEKLNVMSLADYRKASGTQVGTFTNVESAKEIFNLSNNVDCKLNDCVGEKIRVKKILIRRFEKPLDEPKVNEETGEVIESEIKISCVLVDESGKSYATGSKIFTYKLVNYLEECGGAVDLAKGGIELEIVKNPLENGRSSLGFKVL
jgi:hypothetical protein